MRMSDRATVIARRGRTQVGWLGALALTGLMVLPTGAAPLQPTSGTLPPTLFRSAISYSTVGDPAGVTVGDLNGDGIPDMVIGNYETTGFEVRFGNADGTFQSPTLYTYSDNSWYPQMPVIADFNGDGYPDIAITSDEYDQVYVFLNNGHGQFTAKSLITGSTNTGTTWGIAAADVNHDGTMDLIFTENSANKVDIALGVGDGTFHTPRAYATGSDPSLVAVGDLNSDGLPDLAVSTDGSDHVVNILLNTGYGYFHPASSISTGSSNYGLAMGDFTNDGKLDLAVATNSNGLQFYKGKGDGTFYAARTYNPRYDCASDFTLAAGDFNGDGKQDLAVGAGCGDGLYDLWLGDNTGSFAFGGTWHSGTTFTYGITAADVNGDGKSDLIIANYGANGVVLLETALPPSATLAYGSPSKIRNGVNWVTPATPLTVSIAAQGDGAKTVAWRLYAAGATAPAYSTLNSTSAHVSLHGLSADTYVLEYYGISDHGMAGAVQTVYLTLRATLP